MHKNVIYPLLLLFALNLSFSQSNTTLEAKEKIASYYTNYFSLDRETIHLHINKTNFITPEKIWFKGYVLNRKTGSPSLKTTNVYAVLFDSNGRKIAQKLLFTSNGNFAGNFDVSEDFDSGEYYIQTYTNWMNNFTEDESNTRKIHIINPNQGKWKSNYSPNSNSIDVQFHPEGTHFIKNVSNSVAVKLTDCAGNVVRDIDAEVVDSDGKTLKTVKINQFGCGKFEMTPMHNKYKFIFTLEGKKIEAFLPQPIDLGFAMEVNNYILNDKTIITLKTNEQTIASFHDKQFYIVINQDEKVVVHDFNLTSNKLNYETVFSNEHLFTGINCIRIIDNNFNLIAERTIYHYPKAEFHSNLMLNINKNNSLNFVGYSNYNGGNISVSVLPEETKSLTLHQSILYDFTCQPYISETINNFNYFITESSRSKCFELDVLLICQKNNKYKWDLIQNNPPKEKFSFDMGLKVKGTVNTDLRDYNQYKAKLFSIPEDLLITTNISEKKEFEFDNLILAKSAEVSLLLLKMPSLTPVESSIVAQIASKNKPFIKGISLANYSCPIEKEIIPIDAEELPGIKGKSILLDEVEIDKNALKYKNVFGNRNLRSFKIDDSYGNQDLLFFIGANGFKVNRTIQGDIDITSLKNSSLRGSESERPAVFIDGFQLSDNRELTMYTMADVDEIYLDNNYFLSLNGTYGIIKVYLKKKRNTYQKNITNTLTADIGFERFESFENTSYQDYDSNGFKNFGVINFIQYTLIEDDGSFFIQTPNSYEGKIKFVIEGITNDGKLIYEEKILSVD